MTQDAVVISDLHLGSPVCRVYPLLRFLEKDLPNTSRLILLGDVLESTSSRLNKHHWKVLSLLRKLSDSLELIWVKGNHDFDADRVAGLVGAHFVGEHRFISGRKVVLSTHGDTWDVYLSGSPLLVMVADWGYWGLQQVNDSLAIYAKRQSKTFTRCCSLVREQALIYAQKQGVEVILCGHTHHAELYYQEKQRVYANSGCWTEPPGCYLTVKNGEVKLHEYSTTKE